jgi:hypothetical protein
VVALDELRRMLDATVDELADTELADAIGHTAEPISLIVHSSPVYFWLSFSGL